MRSMMLRVAALGLVLGVALGCEGVDEADAPDDPGMGGEEAVDEPNFDVILPAYELPSERKVAGKADTYDDYRKANSQWYANTIAPTGTFNYRSMTEWEPMQRLYITYTAGMVTDTAVAKTLADTVLHTIKAAGTKAGVIYTSTTAKNDLNNRLLAAGVTQTEINAMVDWVFIDHETIWHIDYGPVPLIRNDGAMAFADFRYYHQRVKDDAIPTRLGWYHNVDTFRMNMKTEGGNFQGDGAGTCYVSQRGLQYAGMTSTQFAKVWSDYLACTHQLVVMKDITNDGTGHIDMFFKLVDKNTSIMGEYKDIYVIDALNKQRMDDNAALLAATKLNDGSAMTVYRMPFPSKSGTIPRTYINSTFVNGVNLWPIYSTNKPAEAEALQVWKTVMPTYQHIGILSDKIATYSGTIHCVTRTLPVATNTPWIANGTCTGGKCVAAAPGYTGTCNASIPCKGPEWNCTCPDCNVCGVTPVASCAGYCGGQAPTGCYCDSLCTQYNDCCPDYQQQCVCTPQCSGKVCGSNGCGGSCGTCAAGTTCNASGQCVCVPSCAGKTCGSDGCGGSCGTCAPGTACNASGQCVCVPNCAGKTCGDNGCGGSCGTCGVGLTCAAGQCVCVPNCAGKACGGDGCGGSCGACGAGQMCTSAGQCVCAPDCNGKVCGGDGCGGSCGACGAGFACTTAGQCVCVPNCDGKACGSDGCGGSCGTCGAGTACSASGQCVCVPSCAGKSCGDNGCGGSCGTCGAGSTCDAAGQCVCVPSCDGKACGSDGCGGSCGTCASGETCSSAGACEPAPVQCVATGCNDELCAPAPTTSSCEMTACEAYCHNKYSACGFYGAGGTCGWQPTNNLAKCLKRCK